MKRILLMGLAVSLLWSLSALGQEDPRLDPRVIEVLEGMESFLGGIDSFELRATTSNDVRLESGLLASQAADAHVRVRRPDAFRASSVGDVKNLEVFVEGGVLTVFGPKNLFYAQEKVPASVGEALTHAFEELGIDTPLSDFFRKDLAEEMAREVEQALYLGESTIAGTECHHLAFRRPEFDVQLWVATGDEPLPRKLVILSRWESGGPRFTASIRWDLEPEFAADTFQFTPPEGSTQIEFHRPGSNDE